MMPERIYLPSEVQADIQSHVREGVGKAVDAYESGEEDEDALTGQLGAYLRTGVREVYVQDVEAGGTWRWSIDYRKFQGRGPGATEKIIGADGILELRVQGRRDAQKSLLFQSKKGWRKDPKLLGQALRLSTWREAACVINFSPQSVDVLYLDDVIRGRGTRRDLERRSLDDFIEQDFLPCTVGDVDLRYERESRTLIWRDMDGERVGTKFGIKHRISVRVTPPRRHPYEQSFRLIPTTEIHNHRMRATAEELLTLSPRYTEAELKQRKKQLVFAYHPDGMGSLEDLDSLIATRRMQEINDTFTILEEKLAKQQAHQPKPRRKYHDEIL